MKMLKLPYHVDGGRNKIARCVKSGLSKPPVSNTDVASLK
jgi:hypothetical protein